MMSTSVLYVEDDENDAFFMQRAFDRLHLGDALRVVSDGIEAIRLLESRRVSKPPTLLLLDVKLPFVNGLEVLRWVRAQPEYSATAVAMLTSSMQANDIDLAAQRGANAFLVKPKNAGTLDQLIAPLLDLCASKQPPAGRLPVPGNCLP